MFASPEDLTRLDAKIDKLTELVGKLVVFEERQGVQTITIKEMKERLDRAELKLEMWVNRGIGFWAVITVALAIYKVFGN